MEINLIKTKYNRELKLKNIAEAKLSEISNELKQQEFQVLNMKEESYKNCMKQNELEEELRIKELTISGLEQKLQQQKQSMDEINKTLHKTKYDQSNVVFKSKE